MKSFINFILWSSVNPQRISLTIKAGVPFLMALFAMYNIHVDINPLADQLIAVVNAIVLLISGVYTLVGMVRKIYLTLMGDNPMV